MVLPYDWISRNQSQIITAVAELRRIMAERVCTLAEAEKFRLEPIAQYKTGNSHYWKKMIDATEASFYMFLGYFVNICKIVHESQKYFVAITGLYFE